MITKGFGEIIVDFLTVNPAIATIPTASAILDTSNFTFQAVTFGKDAEGFKYHSHSVSTISPTGDSYNDGFMLIKPYNTSISPSSYHTSATHAALSATYNSVPNAAHFCDTRMERGSTKTNIIESTLVKLASEGDLSLSLDFDQGHYMNPAAVASVSAIASVWNVMGYPPPSSTPGTYIFLNQDETMMFSGTLSSHFNTYGLMDVNGFLKSSNRSISAEPTDTDEIWTLGTRMDGSGTVSAGLFSLVVGIHTGDLAALAALGGINHIGVWCIDMKEMLKDGLRPPYEWDAVNNLRQYKLIGKQTLWDDLLRHEDVTMVLTQASYDLGSYHYSGFQTPIVIGYNSLYPINRGPSVFLYFDFI